MKTGLILVSLLALSQAHVLVGRYPSRIVNGADAELGEIPYQVSLQYSYNDFHFCGGSVLNKNYVITAAHCVVGQSASGIKVIAATLKLSKPTKTHYVEKIIVHEEYDPYNSWLNDIALIKIKDEFVTTSLLSYVPMPTTGVVIPAKSKAIVSGWGRLRQWGNTPDHLQKAELLIADQKYCRDQYGPIGETVHDTHICAHDPIQETGACNGDSGGPLTVNGKLVGIVSWSLGCAQSDYPTVYTRVSEYVDWVKEHTV